MNKLRTIGIASALALCLAPVSAPADTMAGIVGTTFDCATGAALPYAHIVLRAYGSAIKERELVTNKNGQFTALGLFPGVYYIGVEGSKDDAAYWGPHDLKLEPDDIQHVRVGASNAAGDACKPYALNHNLLTNDQLILD